MATQPPAADVATAPPRPRWLDFVPAISLAAVIFGGSLQIGDYRSELANNTRRIVALEASVDRLQQIDIRLARIEIKLELIEPPRRGEEAKR